MSKGAYFLPLYYQRLLTSTTGWKDDEFGAYLRLLIYQFDKGSIPNNMESITRIAPSAKKNWPVIKEKFELGDDGNLRNRVMDNIRKRQLNKSEVSRKNGTKGGRKRNPDETRQVHSGFGLANPEAKLIESNTNMVNGLLVSGIPEEGAGETKPDWIWEKEKDKFLQAEGWQYQFCSSKSVSRNDLIKLQKEFVNDLELRAEYKALDDLKSHFTNWFNKNKKGGKPGQPNNSSPTAPPLQRL